MPALDPENENARIPAKSDSPLPSPVLPDGDGGRRHRRNGEQKSSSFPASPASAAVGAAVPPSSSDSKTSSSSSSVRRTLEHISEVDAIDTLFRFDRDKDVLGSGMYATVFRALPTPDACRRFDLPVMHRARRPSQPTSPIAPPEGGTTRGPPPPLFANAAAGRPHGNTTTTTNVAAAANAGTVFPPALVVSGAPVALKQVEFASIADAKEARNVLREISVLRRLRHPHVASLIGAVRTKSAVYIAMPLAPGVTLSKLLRAAQRDGVALPEKAVSGIVQQLLLALRHVQGERSMIHRDVKLDNVLVAVSSAASSSSVPAALHSSSSSAAAATSKHATPSSSNKPAAGGGGDAEPPMATTTTATTTWCLDAEQQCDPDETLTRLFEPGAAIHVTLVDFGFARAVATVAPPPPPPQHSPECCGSSVVSPVPSSGPGLFPTTTTTARGRQQLSPTAPSPTPIAACTAVAGSPNGPACCGAAAAAVAAVPTKVAYTPCGAHRFMPPEALTALLRGGSCAPSVSSASSAAAAAARPAAVLPSKQGPPPSSLSPQHTPAAHGEAPGVDRDVPPIDEGGTAAMDGDDDDGGAADGEAFNKMQRGTRTPPSCAGGDSHASFGLGNDSDMGSVNAGGGVAFATASDLRKADPFAVGVVAYALLSGCFPWAGETPARLLDTMRAGVRMKSAVWSDVSDAGRELVRHLLCHNPAERPSVEHALAHPWFATSVSTPTR